MGNGARQQHHVTGRKSQVAYRLSLIAYRGLRIVGHQLGGCQVVNLGVLDDDCR